MGLPQQIKSKIDTMYDFVNTGDNVIVFDKIQIGSEIFKIKVYRNPDGLSPDLKFRIEIWKIESAITA